MPAAPSAPFQPAGARSAPARFDGVAIALHWLTLALIIAQFSLGWRHVALIPSSEEAQFAIGSHRLLGAMIWIVTLGRLVWRLRFAKLPPFPPHMSRLQRKLAAASERGLYGLLLWQPLTGLAQSALRGRPFSILFFDAPAFLPPDAILANGFHQLHRAGAYALLALAGIHALAALHHALVLKDGALRRMLPARLFRSEPESP